MAASRHGNPKAAGWDLIGSRFWREGRKSARPSEGDIALFCDGIRGCDQVMVIGASTRELVGRLIELGCRPCVLDFSRAMCEELRSAVGGADADIRHADITAPLPAGWAGSFGYVLSDRLINRFTADEAMAAAHNMLLLLRDGGIMRTTVKIGLYPMDERMIALGAERGTLSRFYDPASRTIDFAAAGDMLDQCLLPHGDIPPDLLLSWYRSRRAEKRFDREEVVKIFADASPAGVSVREPTATSLPGAAGVDFIEVRFARSRG